MKTHIAINTTTPMPQEFSFSYTSNFQTLALSSFITFRAIVPLFASNVNVNMVEQVGYMVPIILHAINTQEQSEIQFKITSLPKHGILRQQDSTLISLNSLSEGNITYQPNLYYFTNTTLGLDSAITQVVHPPDFFTFRASIGPFSDLFSSLTANVSIDVQSSPSRHTDLTVPAHITPLHSTAVPINGIVYTDHDEGVYYVGATIEIVDGSSGALRFAPSSSITVITHTSLVVSFYGFPSAVQTALNTVSFYLGTDGLLPGEQSISVCMYTPVANGTLEFTDPMVCKSIAVLDTLVADTPAQATGLSANDILILGMSIWSICIFITCVGLCTCCRRDRREIVELENDMGLCGCFGWCKCFGRCRSKAKVAVQVPGNKTGTGILKAAALSQ